MADDAVPPYGKRQSTGKKKQASKKLKRGESSEQKAMADAAIRPYGKKKQASKKMKSDEERACEAIVKLKTVYKEEEIDVNDFRDLIMQFSDDYSTDKIVWQKLIEYILNHLPTVIKNGDYSRLSPDHYDGWEDEHRLLDIYMRGRGGPAPEVNLEQVPEVFTGPGPESGSDAGKPESESESDED